MSNKIFSFPLLCQRLYLCEVKFMSTTNNDEVKLLIANSFRKILEVKPVSKITVVDIMNASGMTRQMFYHYFQDIDGLAFWIHMQETWKYSERFYEEEDFIHAYSDCLEKMKQNRSFYRNISKKDGPNSFSSLFFQNMIENANRYIGKKRMSDEVSFALDLYWKGTTAQMVSWIQDGMKIPPHILAERFYMCLPPILRAFYE